MTEMEARIVELESRQAFQDDTLQALNDALVAQQREIERLQAQVQVLAKRIEEGANSFGINQDESPPPHY